jgi:hypothetical protein
MMRDDKRATMRWVSQWTVASCTISVRDTVLLQHSEWPCGHTARGPEALVQCQHVRPKASGNPCTQAHWQTQCFNHTPTSPASQLHVHCRLHTHTHTHTHTKQPTIKRRQSTHYSRPPTRCGKERVIWPFSIASFKFHSSRHTAR